MEGRHWQINGADHDDRSVLAQAGVTIGESRRGEAQVERSLDDVGAGMADLGWVMEFGPEVIKIDLAVTRGIDTDPVRRVLVEALVALAKGADAAVVAEGIETSKELATLVGLGVPYGQGYWLARPGQPARWLD